MIIFMVFYSAMISLKHGHFSPEIKPMQIDLTNFNMFLFIAFFIILNVFSLIQGYYKLLGRGHVPKQPIIVKAKYFSKKAEDRIKAAGGVCLLRA